MMEGWIDEVIGESVMGDDGATIISFIVTVRYRTEKGD